MRNINKLRNFSAVLRGTILYTILNDGKVLCLNIHGLVQIQFPKFDISTKYEEIKKVFEKENVVV